MANFSAQAHGARHDGCRGTRIAGDHNCANSQGVQFRNQRGGVRPGRIAERDDSGKFQRRRWTDCYCQNAEALGLKFVRRLGCIGPGLR
jgi:hypothetical protein